MGQSANPWGRVGILGGGQLGMYSALAARSLGQRALVLDPDGDSVGLGLASVALQVPWDDARAVRDFASRCDVVTIDREDLPLSTLQLCADHARTVPGPAHLHIIQDRYLQKNWLHRHGLPTAPFAAVDQPQDVQRAWSTVAPAAILKTRQGGYDGRGQVVSSSEDEIRATLQQWQTRCILEKRLTLKMELSVMVARNDRGQCAVFPVSFNHHENGVLAWSVTPAPIEPGLARQATDLGTAVAEALGTRGLVAVELFVDSRDNLLVNEVALRPHNTFHATVRSCETSQFEQHIRAVMDLPLGDTRSVRPTAIANVLGTDSPVLAAHVDDALAIQGVKLHWYGKNDARPGRKLGHLSATADTARMAVDRVLEAQARLQGTNTQDQLHESYC